jgi:SAM-dependent methyltransferase
MHGWSRLKRVARTISRLCRDHTQLLYALAVRYPLLRLRGYASANPLHDAWWRNPAWRIRAEIAEILKTAGVAHFDVMLEQGCGTRRHTTPALRGFAKEVWGVDIMARDWVRGADRYIRVDPARADPLWEIADASVDAIVLLQYIGFHPHSTWRAYFDPTNTRLAPYLNERNFLRVLKPGGYFIVVEWEARPEQRWGRASVEDIARRSAANYDPPDLPHFTLVSCGVSRRSPFVVYRRT